MDSTQQLIKKNQSGGYQDIYPKTFIDAIRDKESGMSLSDILDGFNMYFLPYVGSPESTRLLVPKLLRRQGLWITYVKYDKTVVTEWYAGEDISDKAWKNSSNWRIGNNNLVGDITISSDGNWVVNGENTGVKAQGEPGITPLLQIQDNKLQVSYTNGTTWNTISDYIAAWFRMSATRASTAGDKICTIQISRDEGKTWNNLGESFTNSLHIKGYVSSVGSLPSSAVNGDIYGVGPTYDASDSEQTNPIYNLYVKTNGGWIDNGRFTSIAAGVVQTIGTSESEIMSQKAVCDIVGLSEYPTFSESKDYAVGAVVNYEGKLYEFTAEHAQGAWIGTDVTETSLKNNQSKIIDKLKNNTYNISEDSICPDFTSYFIRKANIKSNNQSKKYYISSLSRGDTSLGYGDSITIGSIENGIEDRKEAQKINITQIERDKELIFITNDGDIISLLVDFTIIPIGKLYQYEEVKLIFSEYCYSDTQLIYNDIENTGDEYNINVIQSIHNISLFGIDLPILKENESFAFQNIIKNYSSTNRYEINLAIYDKIQKTSKIIAFFDISKFKDYSEIYFNESTQNVTKDIPSLKIGIKLNINWDILPENVALNGPYIIKNSSIKTSKDYIINKGINLLNPNKEFWRLGYFRSHNGTTIEEDTNYSYHIPVLPNTTYLLKDVSGVDIQDTRKKIRWLTFFEEDGITIIGTSLQRINSFTTPPNCYYVVISLYSDYEYYSYGLFMEPFSEFEEFKAEGLSSPFQGTKDFDVLTNHGYDIKFNGNLNYSVILNFGDSVAYGANSDGIGYADLVAQKLKGGVIDYAKSGWKMAVYPDETTNIVSQVDLAISEVETCNITMLEGGINDLSYYGNKFNLGTYTLSSYDNEYINSLDKSTYCGALEYCMFKLRQKYPYAIPLFIITHKMGTRNFDGFNKIWNAARILSEKWGFIVVDMWNESPLNAFREDLCPNLTDWDDQESPGKGTHPLLKGYIEYYVPLIMQKIQRY